MQFAIDQARWMVVLLGFYLVVRTDLDLSPLKARTRLECFCFFLALPPLILSRYFGVELKCDSVIWITDSRDACHLPLWALRQRCTWRNEEI